MPDILPTARSTLRADWACLLVWSKAATKRRLTCTPSSMLARETVRWHPRVASLLSLSTAAQSAAIARH